MTNHQDAPVINPEKLKNYLLAKHPVDCSLHYPECRIIGKGRGIVTIELFPGFKTIEMSHTEAEPIFNRLSTKLKFRSK